jgi:coatomer subunit beta
MSEKSCGLILYNDSSEVPNLQKIKQDFEKGTDEAKREALKKVIYLLLNGDKVQQLMVPIIRYVTPCKDHYVKKLLLIYWELVDKQNTGDALLLAWYAHFIASLIFFFSRFLVLHVALYCLSASVSHV